MVSPPTRLGRYELVELLGRGGMGEVWEAVLVGPHGFQRRVALKLLPHRGHRRDQRALVREARVGALLAHPNVVGVHDLGQEDGRMYIAMELVQGVSLSALLAEGPLAPALALELGVQACAGLAHIHDLTLDGRSAGLVHRDIKPANLLVDRCGLVKIADLGIVRLTGEPSEPCGTPGYLAPEQTLGQEDHRADQFSLGVTLFVACTGQRPFGVGRDAVRRAHDVEDWLAAGGIAPANACVAGLGEVLGRCLRRDPSARYPDMHQLAEELRRLRSTTPSSGTLAELVAAARPELAPVEPVSSGSGGRSSAETVRLQRGNLPPARDEYVGRAAELRAVEERVRSGGPLITLLGPGGMGKTRLAGEVARRVAPGLQGGAWFCDCSEATDTAQVCSAVARALDLPLADTDPIDGLGHAIASLGPALLVLDNLEQCVAAATEVVGRWLDLAPRATLLCTSRVALRLTHEDRMALGPLPVSEGADLFRRRAPVPIPDADLAALDELVAGLDGMPLAIELAAARTRVLSVPAIGERLEQRFRLLAGGGADRPARHRSLRASLDGSWELLQPWEQAALSQLTVFAEGFTVQAAEAVLDLEAWPEVPWAIDVLEALTDHSLLRVDPRSGRFSLLESVRSYAAGSLTDREGVNLRHARFFAQLGSPAALEALCRTGGLERHAVLVVEQENLVVAARWAIAAEHADLAAALALATRRAVSLRGPLALGLELLEATLALPDVPRRVELHMMAERGVARTDHLEQGLAIAQDDESRARLLLMFAESCLLQGRRRDADAPLARARALLEGVHDAQLEALHLDVSAHALAETGGEDAVQAYQRALEAHRRLGDVSSEARTTGALGELLFNLGRYDEAEGWYTRAILLARRMGDHRREAIRLGALGKVHDLAGRPDEARAFLERALATHRRLGSRHSEASVTANLGYLHARQGHRDVARAHYLRAVVLHREVGNRRGEGVVLGNLGSLARSDGHLVEARGYLEQAIAVFRENDTRLPLGVFLGQLAQLDILEGDLDRAERSTVEAEALLREAHGAGYLCGLLTVRAEVALLRGDRETFAPIVAEATAIAETLGDPGREHLERLQELRTRLNVVDPGA